MKNQKVTPKEITPKEEKILLKKLLDDIDDNKNLFLTVEITVSMRRKV